MKFIKFSLLALALLGLKAQAASVLITDALISSDTANYHYTDATHLFVTLKTSNGNSIGNGATVRLGYFVGYSSNLDATIKGNSFATLFDSGNANHFVPLGEGTAGDGIGGDNKANMVTKNLGGTDGRLATNLTGVNYNDATANAQGVAGVNRGTKLFLILASPNGEVGIYSASDWLIPASGAATTQISLKNVDTAAEVYRGSLGSLVTAPVPEPSALGILALGSLALFNRRRR